MEIAKYFNSLPSDLKEKGTNDESKMLLCHIYNEYFEADDLNVTTILDNYYYSRNIDANIDGIYLNQYENIECVHAYFVGQNNFSKIKVTRIVSFIIDAIEEALTINRFFKELDEQLNKVREYLDEIDEKKIIVRIVTDAILDEKTKFDINQSIENYEKTFTVKQNSQSHHSSTIHIIPQITFGDDIQSTIEQIDLPDEYVESGFLTLDRRNNFLSFNADSFICNISAKSLKDLWKSHGKKGLLAMNLRFFVKAKNIDPKIQDSIMNKPDMFWFLNNGIIIVCDDYKIENNQLYLKNFSIVNGGQTTKLVGETPFENDFFITCKVIKNPYIESEKRNRFFTNIAEASNTQKPIKSPDLVANKEEQKKLKKALEEEANIFYQIKRGSTPERGKFKEKWQKIKNTELAQIIYSFVFMQPGPARNSVSKIFSDENIYNKIFVDNTYTIDFIKSLSFLFTALKEYKKEVCSLNSYYDDDIQGLVKNGIYYALAIIGYFLKMIYNPRFKEIIIQNINVNNARYNEIKPCYAFSNGFIDFKYDYTTFKENSFELFDYIFKELKQTYTIKNGSTLASEYSNFTKNNTGFNSLIYRLTNEIKNYNKLNILDKISQCFVEISPKQEMLNINLIPEDTNYEDDDPLPLAINNVLGNDSNLKRELMLYRTRQAIEKNITEDYIMTEEEIDNLVKYKPLSKDELRNYLRWKTIYFNGNQLISIIKKYK